MINLIWAMDEDWLIGIDNKIPWHIKEDLVYYRSKVNNQIVLMGEETYFSLKGYYKTKPLPYAKIYVASLNKELKLDDAIVVNDAVAHLKQNKEQLWVVGGATIYKLALPYADNLYISFIKGHHEGNRFFPKFDLDAYNLVWQNESELVRYTQFERK